MKVLVIGGGGREHALVWKLAQSPHVKRMWCAPGNGGIGEEVLRDGSKVECVSIGAEDVGKLLDFAKQVGVDMTVVGPDNPLAAGVVDLFERAGLRIWGPNRKAAQFEASKAFSQGFMERHGIPTAAGRVFSADEVKEARSFAQSLEGRCAVKADGLALGKGVLICRDLAEANAAIDEVLLQRAFGEAGATVVIQELLDGPEVSLHALCDGEVALLFPTAKDHKRALDGDQGLNTGGMGAYSPIPAGSAFDIGKIEQFGRELLNRWLKGCAAEGIRFKGILYPGLMLTKAGPKVLEFNARFGDPETQVYLTRLENDLVELLDASIDGRLKGVDLKWKPGAAVCVVMASRGYPAKYEKGKEIRGLEQVARMENTVVFHAGTERRTEGFVTSGGRVLGVTAWGEDLQTARGKAFAAVEKIGFDGAHWRRDIGAKALKGLNIEN